nr:hypothetical protein GCM10020063_011990 [Dactylosporangium thailandense]
MTNRPRGRGAATGARVRRRGMVAVGVRLTRAILGDAYCHPSARSDHRQYAPGRNLSATATVLPEMRLQCVVLCAHEQ